LDASDVAWNFGTGVVTGTMTLTADWDLDITKWWTVTFLDTTSTSISSIMVLRDPGQKISISNFPTVDIPAGKVVVGFYTDYDGGFDSGDEWDYGEDVEDNIFLYVEFDDEA
ncbi:MAG: hypothetical protein FWD37_02525, partial [Methanomassiliicoccaceae archaeon]|nr:hypothetical protein [Methanomassiliicoccaceae archaeon]